jgi:hypothetical protein
LASRSGWVRLAASWCVDWGHYLKRMLLVVNGWDGLGSLIGGAFSGAQALSDKRKRASGERAAPDALQIEVANARNAAVHARSKSRSWL